MRLERLEEEAVDAHGLTPEGDLFSLRSHFGNAMMSAQPADQQADDLSPELEIEAEINDLIAAHGSERAVIRALLDDQATLLDDADRSVSRGFLRGVFSQGARPMVVDDEP